MSRRPTWRAVCLPCSCGKAARELPCGSTVAQVLAFLKIWGVDHTGLTEPEEAIYAELAHTPDTLLTTERVQLQFWFHNGLLVAVNVRELFRS